MKEELSYQRNWSNEVEVFSHSTSFPSESKDR